MSQIETLSPKDRIIQTAIRLFNSNGIHTTGIDRIIAESEVAKKTFYNHFPSKNHLVIEYFYQKDLAWFEMLEKYTGNSKHSSQEQLLGIFDGLQEWFSKPDFYGCPFIRGLADFNQPDSPKEIVSCLEKHFSRTQAIVESLLKKINSKQSKTLLPQMMSLISGSIVVAQATHDAKVAGLNKAIARKLLNADS